MRASDTLYRIIRNSSCAGPKKLGRIDIFPVPADGGYTLATTNTMEVVFSCAT